jgi:hypothetical protein
MRNDAVEASGAVPRRFGVLTAILGIASGGGDSWSRYGCLGPSLLLCREVLGPPPSNRKN